MYPWIEVALKERGVREVPGRLDNARIVEYLRSTSYPIPEDHIDEIAWCSAFENWVFEQCGIRGTGSAWSQSWRDWGVECDPRPGAVAVFKWGGNAGHVTNIYRLDDAGMFCIGGNQKDSVCISCFGDANLVATRWPKGQPF